MEKRKYPKAVRLFVSPTDTGFVCGVIKDEWMYTDEGYLCSVIARGMMKVAVDKPQDIFEQGLDGFQEDVQNKKPPSDNGELREEGAEIIDIVPYFKGKKVQSGNGKDK